MGRPSAREMAAWRAAVFERDNYRCVVCGRHHNAARLSAHHCMFRSQSRRFQTDVNNGVTLCDNSGCSAHQRAHMLRAPYLYFWFDGEVITWTEDKNEMPPRAERERLLELAQKSFGNAC